MGVGFVGFGDLGRQIQKLVLPDGNRGAIYFDAPLLAEGHPQARGFWDFRLEEFGNLEFYVCLGYKRLREKQEVVQELISLGRRLPSFVHPTAHVDSPSSIGAGAIVFPMCNVGEAVRIGRGALLNNSVVVSHDCAIGDCAYLSPGSVLSGGVRIGNRTFTGSGTLASNHVSIGDDVRIGIGTVVDKDVASGVSVIGNPMRIVPEGLDLG